ncbi:MAG: Trk K+ transport system NAD-binding subunit [Halobacteriales archaeon]|jgi:Trk K+ transport system NAD-binding subunit
MVSQQRRIGYYLGTLVAAFALYTVVYNVAMNALEGQPQSLFHSFRVVVTAFTTTGFGADAPNWTTWQVDLLVVAMQFSGLVLIFAALPLFVVPLFEEAFQSRPPRTVDEDLADHVVICEHTAHGESLVEELDTREVDYVVIASDLEEATALQDAGVSVIHGEPETAETLDRANAGNSRAIVADASDERNASIVLAARETATEARIVSIVDDPANSQYHRYAGADQVISPEEALGEALATKVTTRVTAALGDAVEIGGDFEIAEMTVQPGSAVCYRRLADSRIRESTGANVIGVWDRGEFVPSPPPDLRLDERSVLLVAGTDEQLAKLQSLTRSEGRRHRHGPVLVVGHGSVGSRLTEVLAASDVQSTVIDQTDAPGVDVVGDAADEWALTEAGVESARTIVLALDNDVRSIFATLVVRELDPDVEIVARANDAGNLRKLYRAGADYVLALSHVSGRMLAASVLDEDVITYGTQVEIVRTTGEPIAERSLSEVDLRSRTGCTVIAVERDGELITDIDGDFVVQSDDELVVAGPDAAVNELAGMIGLEAD